MTDEKNDTNLCIAIGEYVFTQTNNKFEYVLRKINGDKIFTLYTTLPMDEDRMRACLLGYINGV